MSKYRLRVRKAKVEAKVEAKAKVRANPSQEGEEIDRAQPVPNLK
jgi:hypothetical protein